MGAAVARMVVETAMETGRKTTKRTVVVAAGQLKNLRARK
jgi:hypothetical protein